MKKCPKCHPKRSPKIEPETHLACPMTAASQNRNRRAKGYQRNATEDEKSANVSAACTIASKWTKTRSFVFKKLKCTITSIHRQFKVINLFISFIASKGNHLWEFIRDLLKDSAFNPTLLRWEDKETGVFRFVQSEAVAQMWGRKKNNTSMTYEKLSRAMR